MKKILGVALVGALVLFLLLRYAATPKAAVISPDPSAASVVATAVAATTTAAPVPAAPSPSPVPSPAGSPAAVPVAASDTTACAHLVELCSTSDEKVDPNDCQKQMSDARKMAGASNVERSEQCIAEAKTCAAASGCISGGVGMGAMGEFLKGLGGALSH